MTADQMEARAQEIRVDPKSASTLEGLLIGLGAMSSMPAINRIFASGYQHPSTAVGTFVEIPEPAADTEILRNALVVNRRNQERIDALEHRVAELGSMLGLDQTETRDITKALAKREIRAYFREHDGKEIYPDEIAEALNLDLMQVITVCDELEKDGKITSAA